ncbi:MAG: hypothetical protein LQ343_000143 [Gyalolechia ehrenbergii]|nr:MAG: hypothetical protein LQ343_000143 [Gyalolechia ehrenbergii]
MTQLATDAIRRVAIIGAGPSGLSAAKYLSAENKSFEITIFEQRNSVGGLWHYTPLPSKAQPHVNGHINGSTNSAKDIITRDLPTFNTPMYEDLESNLPLMVMQFSDNSFPEAQLFAKQETVLEYIRDYAEDLRSMIDLEHCVEDVRQTGNGWEVSVKAMGERAARTEQFDAVVVAVNGHTDWPLLPPVEGLDQWSEAYPESIFHSVSYKNPAAFKDKRTLLVGVGPSGSDISRQIGSVSKHPVLVAQRETSPYYTPQSFTQELPGLVSLSTSTRSATFSDGHIEQDIDAIMFCTGYAYTFPFLDNLTPNIVDEPLYQYIFRTETPTLAFMEMNEKIVPFPFAECQAALLARIWSGRLSLPNQAEMKRWGEKVIKERGVGRGFYALDPPLDLQYMNEMHDWCAKASKAGDGGRGKMPKYWDKKEWWEREMAAEMKKAFNKHGERRHEVQSYEELGFRFQ